MLRSSPVWPIRNSRRGAGAAGAPPWRTAQPGSQPWVPQHGHAPSRRNPHSAWSKTTKSRQAPTNVRNRTHGNLSTTSAHLPSTRIADADFRHRRSRCARIRASTTHSHGRYGLRMSYVEDLWGDPRTPFIPIEPSCLAGLCVGDHATFRTLEPQAHLLQPDDVVIVGHPRGRRLAARVVEVSDRSPTIKVQVIDRHTWQRHWRQRLEQHRERCHQRWRGRRLRLLLATLAIVLMVASPAFAEHESFTDVGSGHLFSATTPPNGWLRHASLEGATRLPAAGPASMIGGPVVRRQRSRIV